MCKDSLASAPRSIYFLAASLAILLWGATPSSLCWAAELKTDLVNKTPEGEGLVLRDTGQVQLTFPDGHTQLLPYRSCFTPRVAGGKVYIFTTREEALTGIVVYDISHNYAESFPVPADLKREFSPGSPSFSPDGTKVAYYFVSRSNEAFIDRTGKVVKEPPEQRPITPRREPSAALGALIPLEINGKWGFLDARGEMVVPAKFEFVYEFSEGLALVKVGGKWGFIDKTGKAVIPPQYAEAGSFSEGLARVNEDGRWGYINRYGQMVIPPQYDSAGDFSEGLGRVRLHKKHGFIDRAGKMAIQPKYHWAEDFYQGVAPVTMKTPGEKDCCDGGVRVRSWPGWRLLWQSPLYQLTATDCPPNVPIWKNNSLVEFDPRFFDPPRFLKFQAPGK